MSLHEKNAWWGLVSGILIWMFLAMRLTEGGQLVGVSPGLVLETYVGVIVLSIAATALPAVLLAKDAAGRVKDERDRGIDALGDRWEGYVVVVAVNALIVHMLMNEFYVDRSPSLPRIELGSSAAMVFALLTVLFLAEGVKQAVIVWQYRR
jgi:hypothetical protein